MGLAPTKQKNQLKQPKSALITAWWVLLQPRPSTPMTWNLFGESNNL
jgi:hypothetical protein